MKLQAASGFVIVTDGNEEIAVNIDHIVSIVRIDEDQYRLELSDSCGVAVDLPLGIILAAIRTAKSMTGAGIVTIPDSL